MGLNELYKLLQEQLKLELEGELSFEGFAIKWEYDSFNKEIDDYEGDLEHLHRIYNEDLEIINDNFNLDIFNITEPTIEDTYISFYIE